jgi:hypothetical protein
MSVHKKLMAVRCDLLRTKLEKSGHNKFAGYRYFELGDFMPATMDLFYKHGLCGVVSYDTEYAKLCITDVEDGTVIVITSPMATAALKGAHDIQNLGAVETYQRRYLWMTALELTENDPIDSTAGSEPPPKPVAKPAPKPVEAPKPPPVIEGKELPWKLKISATPEAGMEEWLSLVSDSTDLMLDTTASKDDVMNIFKVNRIIYDRIKADAPDAYEELMNKFKKAKDNYGE